MADDFLDMLVEDSRDDNTGKIPMLVRVSCINLPEYELEVAMSGEPLLVSEVTFEQDGIFSTAENSNPVEYPAPTTPALEEIKAHIRAIFQLHITLARSLGAGATCESYYAACSLEQIPPIALRSDGRI